MNPSMIVPLLLATMGQASYDPRPAYKPYHKPVQSEADKQDALAKAEAKRLRKQAKRKQV